VKSTRWARPLLILWVTLSGFTLLLPATQERQGEAAPSAAPKTPPPPDVGAPPAGALTAASGLAMTVLEPGTGTENPAADDCVVVSFTAWRRNGSLFSTSGLHGEPATQCLAVVIPGIVEALMAMVTGEKRRVWVPADLAFAARGAHHGPKKMHEKPPPEVDLTVDLELIRILKAPSAPADLQSPPPTALRTASGVMLQVLQPGTGNKHPAMSSRVTLRYSGWTAGGKLFESTEMSGHPAAFLVGTTLPGWREALPRMVVGEKVRVWIPAALAYGEHPIERHAPAGNLVYDIELVALE